MTNNPSYQEERFSTKESIAARDVLYGLDQLRLSFLAMAETRLGSNLDAETLNNLNEGLLLIFTEGALEDLTWKNLGIIRSVEGENEYDELLAMFKVKGNSDASN